MEVEIHGRPWAARLQVRLEVGERLLADLSGVIRQDEGLRHRRWHGRPHLALLRRLLAGEPMRLAELIGPGSSVVSQALPGDLHRVDLADGARLHLQPGTLVATDAGVRPGLGWAGWPAWLSGAGLVRTCLRGPGRVWFGGIGGISALEVGSGQEFAWDHLVAWEGGVAVRARRDAAGLRAVVHGVGRLWLQARTAQAWAGAGG